MKNVKFTIIKTRIGWQYVGYFYYTENLNWAACGPRVGHSCSGTFDSPHSQSAGTYSRSWRHIWSGTPTFIRRFTRCLRLFVLRVIYKGKTNEKSHPLQNINVFLKLTHFSGERLLP